MTIKRAREISSQATSLEDWIRLINREQRR